MHFNFSIVLGLLATASLPAFASPLPLTTSDLTAVGSPNNLALSATSPLTKRTPGICTATSTSILRTAVCTITKLANRGTPTKVTWTAAQVFTLTNDLWKQVANGGSGAGALVADVTQGGATFKAEIVLSSPYTTTWDALGNKVTFSAIYDAINLSANDGWGSSRNTYTITMNNNLERVATIYISMFNCLS